ncbi:MAG: tRNA dihydrouridine synthase DusB [Fibrobacter sp.]|nr:tRNA dihydrouridine synthase DusB [Fibrobacter sp.]
MFNKKLILAPMAGVTDSVFRQICKKKGADIVVSEMVSAEGLFYKSKNTLEIMRFIEMERPIGIQLFGSNPDHLARAAVQISETIKPDFLDLNSGCPVSKVVSKNGGASLLKDRPLFETILKTLVSSTTIPITVKIRSGWNKYEWVDTDFAKAAEQCGVAAITVHPRSQTMMFTGHSFWDRIAAVKQSVSIPVIGNGDIVHAEDAVRMFNETGCDSVMIGRGTYGNPWIFEQIRTLLNNKPITDTSIIDRLTLALEHLELFKSFFSESHAAREMKKHCAWYIKGVSEATVHRNHIFRADTYQEIYTSIEKLIAAQHHKNNCDHGGL